MNLSKFTITFEKVSYVSGAEVAIHKYDEIQDTDMHTHEYIEIAFVQAGRGWHVLGEKLSRCEAGCVYVIDIEEPHAFVADEGSPFVVYNLMFRPAFFDVFPTDRQSMSEIIKHFLLRSFRYYDFSHSLSAKFEAEKLPVISELFHKMFAEYTSHEPGFEELIRAWTIELMVYVFRKLCAEEGASVQPKPVQKDIFDNVFEYIQQNYTEAVSLEKLSMLAFVSPKYFSRMFKEHTGCTVTEYTQKLRIASSCKMLRESDAPLTEIAEQTGYSDVKYFGKVFRRIMGVSPAEYRRKEGERGKLK